MTAESHIVPDSAACGERKASLEAAPDAKPFIAAGIASYRPGSTTRLTVRAIEKVRVRVCNFTHSGEYQLIRTLS